MSVVEERKRSSAPRRPSRPRAPAQRSNAAGARVAARNRQLSSKVKVFDEHTRAEIKRKRLASLEADNWVEDRRRDDDEDDDEYIQEASSGDGQRAHATPMHLAHLRNHLRPLFAAPPKPPCPRALARRGRGRCAQTQEQKDLLRVRSGRRRSPHLSRPEGADV